MTFDGYADLSNNSIKTFAKLECMFIMCFTSFQQKVTINDLVVKSKRLDEILVDYIIW